MADPKPCGLYKWMTDKQSLSDFGVSLDAGATGPSDLFFPEAHYHWIGWFTIASVLKSEGF